MLFDGPIKYSLLVCKYSYSTGSVKKKKEGNVLEVRHLARKPQEGAVVPSVDLCLNTHSPPSERHCVV